MSNNTFPEDLLSAESSPAVTLTSLMVDGRHLPSGPELLYLVRQLDLLSEFKDVTLIESNSFTLSFDSTEKSHIFLLALGAKALEKQLFSFNPTNSLYSSDLLDDYRIDGGQFTCDEQQNVGKTELIIHQKNSTSEDQVRFKNLLKEFVDEYLPHLSSQVVNINLD